MKKYQIIYADPPWKYKENWGNGAVHHHYKSLSIDELKALPVGGLADVDCHLYLWVTNPFIQEGLDLIKAWGFEYKQIITWVKISKDGATRMGLGYYFRGTTEHCLFAVKGKLPRINKSIKNILFAEHAKHSRKPDIFRDIIVAHSGDRERVELFARQKIKGWDSWGNEVENDLSLVPSTDKEQKL